ncbi:acyl-CoA dehydrogenase C-terminal domain-containing protein [Noviherbaspirillum denitrificans]|uniref:3-methylmercaptopropionyl-CoA dehydrogenase n=1 Tax=Noviherbaspirillum denitrificans TaxID=1968433 RepID=A0A254T6P8_9BURK|nr:acyl-CoA dehydrogenase C-terminal domain-containing protein [Noviherbaspirillum denitrificans]OWW18321.1 acyl-CoA dehydrogenase [Noviherbaspirillum denitrificans]
MGQYLPPLRDTQFVLHELLDAEQTFRQLPPYADLDRQSIDQVIEAAGKFSSDVLFPLNLVGDREGCTLHEDGAVSTPSGFKEAYAQYVDAGWPALSCDPNYGGQGLPLSVYFAEKEMQCAANQAWAGYVGLSHGAYECLHASASAEIKAAYLPKLASGEWTGTMCLTEPHCGTDLGLLRTKAEPQADGSYAVTGTKIFISGGEHDMTDNIVHLVLARIAGAPPGVKGISLFVVPKFLPDANGESGERNGVRCGSIEHKMGIHGNSTCVMNFDDAKGWLVGEPGKGLAAMFVMMNASRILIGVQCIGLTDIAYQNAALYAKDRLQSRALTGPAAPDKPADPIIVHPDVRRMLLTQKAYAEGGRALAYWLALHLDQEQTHPDAAVRAQSGEMVALMTPVLKAFMSDNALEATNHGMMVLGGHGYIHEWGMEQFARDARISSIYEGTNTIQALDLLNRKVLSDGGGKLRRFCQLATAFVEEQRRVPEMQEFITPLMVALDKVLTFTDEIAARAQQDAAEIGAASTHYLRVVGHFVFAYFWARMARVALDKADTGDRFYEAKLATARFYFAKLLPELDYHLAAARAGAAPLMELDEALF